jgi:UDPglucose--hexose-1-phosphate uridylyltransferase
MVGFELLGSPQRDITPESAALTLRTAIEGARFQMQGSK